MSTNMASVTDGVIENKSITSTKVSTKGTTSLGKDAFLQLLVAQMQYQDPLEPSSDTEWISQLATFSSLEEMQNMSSTLASSQAFSMVGKTVSITTENGSKEGVVDFVTKSGNKTYVSVDGEKYEVDKVEAVLGEDYLATVHGPKVTSALATYDFDAEKDLNFEVKLGDDKYAATGLYVAIDGNLVNSDYLSYDDKKNQLTIKAGGLDSLVQTGHTYQLSILFDNPAQTTISDKIKINVIGKQPEIVEAPETSEEGSDTSTGDKSGTI